ncbi:hypothetical protein BGZ65_000995 [Modicella reniformis]|uniref:RRM domain-containing protein n=1 Tax=Modicella reniformis TaxID=1440133 RepID=A0A9P6J270_9FUNG|nr:hypothetical protein BGZ65_000995 [Modicella reniformis]
MVTWNTLEIPANATPNLIIVTNISAAASEKTVKDFFMFCGKLNGFELQKDEDRQVALVLFDRESAAKTACMLTNAIIIDSAISVKPYFEELDNGDNSQENKPKTQILAELLAAGYKIQDAIIEKGIEIDNKFGVTRKVQGVVEAAKTQAQVLDEKFKVTEKAHEFDHKYHVQDRVNTAIGQGIGFSNQALQSGPGQKVAGVASHIKDQIAAVYVEARRIANDGKAKSSSGVQSDASENEAEAPLTKEKEPAQAEVLEKAA